MRILNLIRRVPKQDITFTPPVLFIASYTLTILAGAALLKSPACLEAGMSISWTDAFYTATSALCVTGLTVVDTARTFSPAGEFVIMVLIQTGGFGLMAFFALVFLWAGSRVSAQHVSFIKESYSLSPILNARLILRIIFAYTIVCEALGAAVLVFTWDGPLSLGMRAYYGIFHSISAFNNAGFTLFADNLAHYKADILLNLTITSLIILGGIGAPVIVDLWSYLHSPTRFRLSLHTKLTLVATAALVVGGTAAIWLIERTSLLYRDTPLHVQVMTSFFHAVSARTAGFNTINLRQMGTAPVMILMLLMFVGASPGSCGGGIKTTSMATLFVVLWNRIKGRNVNNVFHSTLPNEAVNRTVSVFILASIFTILMFSALLVTQVGEVPVESSGNLFIEYLFETISAFGT
ncbi:MAG TPA: potassium transporter TrkG, partial [Deltaproteobacteria bacterium]|nr:potassium transporter TrkG [Deltaproteobacteria bacterium]